MNITTEQLHILQHSIGVDAHGHGEHYRNYYCAPIRQHGAESTWNDLDALIAAGYMRDIGPVASWGHAHGLVVTDAGKVAIKAFSSPRPKLTRSQRRWQEYSRVAECFDSFRDWPAYRKEEFLNGGRLIP